MEIIRDVINSLEILSVFLTDQETYGRFYNNIGIIGTTKLFDYDRFHAFIRGDISQANRSILQDFKNIYSRAELAISEYERMIDILPESLFGHSIIVYKIYDPWAIEEIRTINDQSEFSNENAVGLDQSFELPQLLRFCFNIVENLPTTIADLEKRYLDQNFVNTGVQTHDEPTTGQIALFFYYLEKAKIEVFPDKAHHWLRLMNKYHLKNSPDNVRNHYYRIGKGLDGKKTKDPMTLKNLAKVSELLKKYPEALKLLKKDYSSLETELKE